MFLDGKERMAVQFVCGHCGTKSIRLCQKVNYYHSLVIMQCENNECKKWHLIADHLQWFEDEKFMIEQLLNEGKTPYDMKIQNAIGNLTKRLEIKRDRLNNIDNNDSQNDTKSSL